MLVPANLSKLSNLVKNDIVKKTEYDGLVHQKFFLQNQHRQIYQKKLYCGFRKKDIF